MIYVKKAHYLKAENRCPIFIFVPKRPRFFVQSGFTVRLGPCRVRVRCPLYDIKFLPSRR